MNKYILSIVILGVAFWGTFVAKLIHRIPAEQALVENTSLTSLPTLDDLQKWIHPQPLPSQSLRDPFRPASISTPKTRKSFVAKNTAEESKPFEQPKIGIDAILPGDNPVAILRHHGETAIVRVGQSVWNVTVQSVSQNSVTLLKDGKSFVIQK